MTEVDQNPDESQEDRSESRSTDIAIIGMAGRFPGARDIDEFWENLRGGVESIRQLSEDELLAAGATRSDLSDPAYVRACPVLEDVDMFDAGFFGFSPRDASVTDPAHRFFLEVVYEALEHSGCSGLPDEGAVGVFAGSGASYYYMDHVRTNVALMRSMGEFLVRHTGNDMNFLATRASYEFDFRGPSINVQTACSTALVSLHMAARSLIEGECDLAIAGGSTIPMPHGRGYHYKEGEILSPDGHCRPFDARSAGTVFGSGAGAVVLKRLDDALDDGDTIHAVVKGSAVNNDGSVKVGFLAPGVDGQVGVVTDALKMADLSAEDISYVEAHGTGTSVGDPIELTALQQAFSASTDRKQFCAVGSVKSNIGHLGEAAATASLIKVIMALKHRQIPPSLGYETPNEQFDMEGSAFFVNAQLREWKRVGDKPLRCGITALGAGGTNCHVILEEPPAPLAGEGDRSHSLIQLSAKSAVALDAMSEKLATAFESVDAPDLADAAYTLAVGRRRHQHRRVLVVHSPADAVERLRTRDRKQVFTQSYEGATPSLVFMFPGGGAQYARMGMDLYESEDVYRDAVDECLAIVNPVLGRDLAALMFVSEDEVDEATRALEAPSFTLPALFSTSYALAQLFLSWGLEPTAMLGHSMGEYVAACLAGVFSLEDALSLVMLRGRLFETSGDGGMVSISLSERETRELMPSSLSIAAANAPDLCVASGPAAAIAEFEDTLRERDVDFTHVHIDVAAHSSMLEPILDEFRRACRKVAFSPPTIPFPSNLTGTWIKDEEATDPEYWVKHLRNTVRFAECVETLLAEGERAMVEIGPGRTLSSLARAQVNPVHLSINSMRHPMEEANDVEYALLTLGKLWMTGVDVDMHALYSEQLRNRIPLPRYPFDHQAYWVDPGQEARHAVRDSELVKRENQDEWFYGMSWVQQPLAAGPTEGTSTWMILEDGSGIGKKLRSRLGSSIVISVLPGDGLEQLSDHQWMIDPDSFSQFRELFEQLARDQLLPGHIVSLWGLNLGWRVGARLRSLLPRKAATGSPKDAIVRNFHALVNVGRAIGELEEPAQFSVVSNESAQLFREWVDPLKALQLGPVGVIPREFPLVRTRCIDIEREAELFGNDDQMLEQLVRELRGEASDRVVALRSGQRWVRRVVPSPLAPAPEVRTWVRSGGVYVITGGLGGIGLEVAQSMAATHGVKLALLGRSELPEKHKWDSLLADRSADPRVISRIRRVRALQEIGAIVMAVTADVTDEESLRAGLDRVRSTLGPINGVIHAAGRMDDAPMQNKSVEAMDKVLAAKVVGTRLLDDLITEKLDYFVLFSSIASFVGLPGQVDYTAANAFLDAFARERSLRAPGRTVVINWNAWRDVGMAVEALQSADKPVSGDSCAHPALDGVRRESDSSTFSTDFSVESHWLLSEHRIKDAEALIAGTGFLELIRAAYREDHAEGAMELFDITFVSPFQVTPGEPRRLNIELTSTGEVTKVVLYSSTRDHPHVVGNVRDYPESPPASIDVAAISRRCDVRMERVDNRFLDQEFVDFGPRWANIDVIRYGDGEALTELSLDPQFEADLVSYQLHPAVMDMATGGCQGLIPGFDRSREFYVPLSYATLRVFGAMPSRCFSHVRAVPQAVDGLAGFDVTLCDADGNVFAEVKRFIMKRVDPAALASIDEAISDDSSTANPLAAVLREAIASDEGVQVLDRIMAQPDVVQVVASSVDPVLWTDQLDAEGGAEEGGVEALVFERPTGAGDLVEPVGPTQLALAAIWSELLGIKNVGATDDFFDLGGDSLGAVRLMRRIKKSYGLDFGIARLFEAPDIQSLSVLIDGLSDGPSVGADEVAITALRLERVPSMADWGLRPVWRERAADPVGDQTATTWLLFMDEAGVGEALQQRLRAAGHTVVTARTGDTFSKRPGGAYSLAPEKGRGGYDELLADLQKCGTFPTHIVHLWLVTVEERFRPGSSFFHQNLQEGFYSLFYLAQALADVPQRSPVHIMGVTSGAQSIGSDGHVAYPEKATMRGPLRGMARELDGVTSTYVDVNVTKGNNDAIVRALHKEAQTAAAGEVVTLRGGSRHVRRFESMPFDDASSSSLKAGGCFVITGGLSGQGLALARGLARSVRDVNIALFLPAALPPENEWDALMADERTGAEQVKWLRDIRELRAVAAEVLVLEAEIINVEEATAALATVKKRFGSISGIFHCEGSAKLCPISLKTEIDVEDIFAAKVHGTRALGPMAVAVDADFLMLFSSTDALTTPAGLVEQLGGDAFLDAYASSGACTSSGDTPGTRVVSVNWGHWEDRESAETIAALGARDDAGEELSSADVAALRDSELAISESEAIDAISRVLSGQALPQVWVSPLDHRSSLTRAEAYRSRLESAGSGADGGRGAASATSFKHLVPMHRGNAGERTPFFLIAGMFGNVLNLRYLANLVGTDRKFYGVQAKGLFGGEEPNGNFPDMVRDYLAEIRQVQPHGPYMIGGFSGGGIAAYEMALTLRAEGEEVAILLMIDTPLPRRRPLSRMDRMEIQFQRIKRKGPRYLTEWLRNRARWEVERLQERFGSGSKSVSTEDRFHNEAIQAAFLHACETYEVRPYPGQLILFRPKPDRYYVLRDGSVLDVGKERVTPDNGWTDWVDRLDVFEMPGGHDSMVLEPNVRVMAARLKQCIAEVEGDTSS